MRLHAFKNLSARLGCKKELCSRAQYSCQHQTEFFNRTEKLPCLCVRLVELTMTTLDINNAVKAMLDDFKGLNTHIGYEGTVFGGGTEVEQEDWDELLEETWPFIIGEKLDSGFTAEVGNWHSHSVCLTGLSFDQPLIFEAKDAETGSLNFPATIKGGVGERYLYKALGERSLTVEIPVTDDWLKLDDGKKQIFAFFKIGSVSMDFLSETEAEIEEIFARLKKQTARFQNQLTISQLSQSYKNFQKLTGLDQYDLG
jgi:hypothetical protein